MRKDNGHHTVTTRGDVRNNHRGGINVRSVPDPDEFDELGALSEIKGSPDDSFEPQQAADSLATDAPTPVVRNPATQSVMKLAAQTQSLTERVTRSTEAVTTYLYSEEFRWKALVTTGRFTAHSMVILVGIVAVLLAGFKIGNWIDKPKTTVAAVNPAISNSAGFNTVGAPQSVQASIARSGAGTHLFTLAGTQAGTAGQPPVNGMVPLPPAQSPGGAPLAPMFGGRRDDGVLSRQIVLDTAKPVESRQAIVTYTVGNGDTIEAIAARFGLFPTTLIWSNQEVEDAPDILKVGQSLNILPVNGVYYSIQDGDTLESIAEKFKANVADIVASPLNGLQENQTLTAGVPIVIPSGVKPFQERVVEETATTNNNQTQSQSSAPAAGSFAYTAPAPAYTAPSGNFLWPTAANYVSQGYWWGHRGIDIAASIGIPIYASDSGCVSSAGWSNVGYGYMILLNHGNGFQTLYGHLSQYYVEAGQCVSRGQVIGAMGSTGNSTGPHLHFEIRVNGTADNPYFYLQ